MAREAAIFGECIGNVVWPVQTEIVLNWDIEADLVVVGGGGAGLTAAGTAAKVGKELDVVLLEKNPNEPCNTEIASNFVPAAGTRFQRAAAADLSARGQIAIVPTYGWWNKRPNLEGYIEACHYALIVSISTPETDIYTPVANQIGVPVEVEV